MRITNFIVLSLVLIFITASLFFYFISDSSVSSGQKDIDLQARLSAEERIQGLIIHEKDGQLDLLYLVSYEPITERASWIYFDPEIKLFSPTFAREIELGELYTNLTAADFKLELEELLEFEISYWAKTEGNTLSYLIDFLGGIRIEPGDPAPSPIPDGEEQQTYGRWIDGEMALDFAAHAYEEHGISGLRFRHKTLFLGVVEWFKNNSHLLKQPEPLRMVYDNLDTSFDFEDFSVLLSLIPGLEESKIKFLIAQSPKNIEAAQQLNAHRISTMLPPPVRYLIETTEDRELIRIQVLNGAGIAGLAGAVRDKIQHHPYIDVVEVDNADHPNYENTVIIDRGGHPRSAARVQELLQTGEIEIDLAERLLVDVTIIAGRDLAHFLDD